MNTLGRTDYIGLLGGLRGITASEASLGRRIGRVGGLGEVAARE